MRCRQPEKILFPPEFLFLLTEPVELGALLSTEQPLVFGVWLAAVDSCLPDPAGQAAGRQAKALCDGVAGKVFLQAELNSLRLLLRREPASALGG